MNRTPEISSSKLGTFDRTVSMEMDVPTTPVVCSFMSAICSRSRAQRSVAITFLLVTLAALCGNTTAWADSELRETLGNMIYPSEWTRSGQAPLVGGVYEEPAAPGSASNIVIRLTDSLAVGRIGDQTMAALVIVTDPGGSGIFSTCIS